MAFYFTMLLPVCVILFGNVAVLIKVLGAIQQSTMLKQHNIPYYQGLIGNIRISFICAVLMGLTWVFAIFAVGELRDVFQWLFCIFNSLQGFFIFIFYTVRNKDVQNELRRCFGCSVVESSRSTSTNTSKKEIFHLIDPFSCG